jgi:predicted molibdopterin-dependent oxidoreductase YjgC
MQRKADFYHEDKYKAIKAAEESLNRVLFEAGNRFGFEVWKEGKANHGHSCVKGRFAFDYYMHPDRVRTPMIRNSIDEPWREVSWDEAFRHTASEFRRIQAQYGPKSIGAASSPYTWT